MRRDPVGLILIGLAVISLVTGACALWGYGPGLIAAGIVLLIAGSMIMD